MNAFGERRRDRAIDLGLYLRTGRIARGAPLELKYNHNHDPRDGRFTFASGGGSAEATPSSHGQSRRATPPPKPASPGRKPRQPVTRGGGGFSGGGGGAFGGGGATGYYLTNHDVAEFKRQHPGLAPHLVQPGDTLKAVAERAGTSQAKLAALNGIPVEATLRPGDVLGVPMAPKPPAPERFDLASVALRVPTPTSPYSHILKNGYDFGIDATGRMREVSGTLTSNPDQIRSRRSQSEAGGADRLPTDQGGHYIARRFNGPTEAFNHFAQDANFNRGKYRAIANTWARAQHNHQSVWVKIVPTYLGLSKRPDSIRVIYKIGTSRSQKDFSNHPWKRS